MSAAPVAPAKVPSLSPSRAENAQFSAAKPQLSRGPASVSARSSSPTLELVEINNEDEIAGIVAAEAETATPATRGIDDLERLAAAKPASIEPQAVSKPPSNQPRAPMPRPASLSPIEEPQAFGRAGVVQGGSSTVSVMNSGIPESGSLNTLPIARRRKSRAPTVIVVCLLIVVALVASYVVRQPAALYGFLRARGWEQALDRTVQPVALKIKKLIHL